MRRSIFWLLDHYPETGESVASLHATALAHARLADQLGFDTLWLAEHHLSSLGTAPNPAVVLAAIAQATSRIRVGPAVAVLPLRNPIQVAEDYALVDSLSGGRLRMGVGTGSRPLEFAGMGVDFDNRREAFDAALAELCERWRAAAAGERGASSLNVPPVQTPQPRIYVATRTDEGAYAAGLAGHCLLTLVAPLVVQDLGAIQARLAAHARGLADGGHANSGAEMVVVVFAHVAPSAVEAHALAIPALGRLLQTLTGAAPTQVEESYHQMRERGLGRFGTRAQVNEQIQRYAAIGVEHLALVTRFGGLDAAAAEFSLRALAPAA